MRGLANRLPDLVVLVVCAWMQGREASEQLLREPPAKLEIVRKPPALDRIRIQVDPRRGGAELERHREIAARFAAQSIAPEDRAKAYAWAYPKPDTAPTGFQVESWWGSIERLTSTPEGWVVEVAVLPFFANGATALRSKAAPVYREEYLYANGRLEFRKAIPAPTPRRPIAFVF